MHGVPLGQRGRFVIHYLTDRAIPGWPLPLGHRHVSVYFGKKRTATFPGVKAAVEEKMRR